VSSDNPHGNITNSDFEQAAMVVQLDNIANSYDVRGATISNLMDNTPTLTRHFKGSTTTSGPAAYLCQISSLHQRYHRCCSEVSFINGVENVMADDASLTQIPVMCASVGSPLTLILVPLFPACSYLCQFEFKDARKLVASS